MKTWSPIYDFAALGCSAVCVVHCALLPLGFLFIPSAMAISIDDETFHQVIVLFVIPISVVALALGCSKHKQVGYFICGSIGLLLLAVVGFYGHDILGELGEKVATVLATALISVSHVMNYRLCRQVDCDCHDV